MKYKYFLKRPRSEIAKDIFKCLMLAGAITVAASSPYFVRSLAKGIKRELKKKKKISDRCFSSTFYRLRKEGCLQIRKHNHQVYISLTPKGKKKAGWMQIDDLNISRPKKWDGKWRIIIFDINQSRRLAREALRGRLKELGFCLLQKSVWLHPFNCKDEINLLKDFFGLSDDELRLIISGDIGECKVIKKFFKI